MVYKCTPRGFLTSRMRTFFFCKINFNAMSMSVKWTHGCLRLNRLISFCLFHVSQFEKLEGIPELGVLTEGEGARDERLGLPETSGDALEVGTVIPLLSPERHQQQVPAPARTEPNTTIPPRDSLGCCHGSLCLKDIKFFPHASGKQRKYQDHQRFILQPRQTWM